MMKDQGRLGGVPAGAAVLVAEVVSQLQNGSSFEQAHLSVFDDVIPFSEEYCMDE
jgi:hypothetical protein